MISRGEGIPTTRAQAEALIRALSYDYSRLTPDQAAAFRLLYLLDDDRPISEIAPVARSAGVLSESRRRWYPWQDRGPRGSRESADE